MINEIDDKVKYEKLSQTKISKIKFLSCKGQNKNNLSSVVQSFS